MLSKELFIFLKDLKKNNNKEWFENNRSLYNNLKKEFEIFVNLAIAEISLFDKPMAQTSAKASIFRINRDIRFSADKLPYKNNFGAFIANGGRKSISAGYYIHLEPGQCFLSGGIYMPSGPILKAIRTEIFENIREFKKIVQSPFFVRHFGKALWGEKLKLAPKGFPGDFTDIEYLKFKHYTVLKEEPDSLYHQNALLNEIKEVFQSLALFNAFLNRAIENMD
jgi:uncharacterized protein (TIGR02453 family)